MVGWHFLLLLAIEIALYGAAGWYVHVGRGWNIACTAGLVITLYVGLRAVLVANEFALARRKGSPIPDASRVPPLRLIAMYLREVVGWVLLFSFVLPFVASRRSVLTRAVETHKGNPPLLLIHGFICNRGTWFWFRRQLVRGGHQAYAVDCTPPFASITDYAPQVARAVDEILAATGAKRLVLIGHSMGGLISRAYLDEFGSDKIAHVITLGTPHLGTWMTTLAAGPNVRDMAESSPWLARLRARESVRSARPYANFTCIYSYHDNLVAPQTNAVLPGAEQIALSGIGHVSLVLSREVNKHVQGILERLRNTG